MREKSEWKKQQRMRGRKEKKVEWKKWTSSRNYLCLYIHVNFEQSFQYFIVVAQIKSESLQTQTHCGLNKVFLFCDCWRSLVFVGVAAISALKRIYTLKTHNWKEKLAWKMFTSNWTFLMNVLPIVIILFELKFTFPMPRQRFRIYRSKGGGPPPFPPILSFSPPRMASAQNFHSDYAAPPFSMNGPPMGYTHPPNMDYDHPNGLQLEYGPPSTTLKPVIHKHVC